LVASLAFALSNARAECAKTGLSGFGSSLPEPDKLLPALDIIHSGAGP